jgi:hypothetical protein
MNDRILEKILVMIQVDVNHRARDINAWLNFALVTDEDFALACEDVAKTDHPVVGIVTGFLIPHAQPPAGETDGPLGALFLARVLTELDIQVILVTDPFAEAALAAGLKACGLEQRVGLLILPSFAEAQAMGPEEYWRRFASQAGPLTHLIAVERVGPSHTPASLRAHYATSESHIEQFQRTVPPESYDRCHTMHGRDITTTMSPAHWLFEAVRRHRLPIRTLGIGDGGNEIGMGQIAWYMIARHIPRGDIVACRVQTDWLMVCGISNWGAYGLAAGIGLCRGAVLDPRLFDPEEERRLLQLMVERGPLVDGVTGQPTVTVDGLSFERYVEVLRQMGALLTPPNRNGSHPS